MKRFIAIAASLLINLGVVIAFEYSAQQARPLPNGEVIVTELSVGAASLAQTTPSVDTRVVM